MHTLLILATAVAIALPFPASAQDKPDRCAQLRRQLEIVDAQIAKRPSDQLNDRRRVIVAEMGSLKCSETAGQ